jgi:outer membrane lipoprotein-sorting protein
MALLAPGGAGRAAVPSDPEQAAALQRIEGYLNGLRSLRSTFLQVNPDGAQVTGQLYYQRPDKMRLDYDPPSPIQIVANGSQVLYHDRKLKQVSHLFVSQTPLAFLLQEDIRFAGGVTVADFRVANGEVVVTVVETDQPDQGAVSLVFGQAPLVLRRWVVVDAQGLTTRIQLQDLEQDVALDEKLFALCDPTSVIRASCE